MSLPFRKVPVHSASNPEDRSPLQGQYSSLKGVFPFCMPLPLMIFSLFPLSDLYPRCGKGGQRRLEVLPPDQHVVGVVGGDCEDADLLLRKDPADPGQDADQGEVQHSLDPKGPPAVLPGNGVRRYLFRLADQRDLLISAREKKELRFPFNLCQRCLLVRSAAPYSSASMSLPEVPCPRTPPSRRS